MKKQLSLLIVAVLVLLVTGISCNRQGKSSEAVAQETIAKKELLTNDEIKARLIEIIVNSPKPLDIAKVANEAGASYSSDLLLQDNEYERMLTSTQKAFGVGLIGFDCKYTSVYNRPDEYLRCRSHLNRFISDLGLQEVLARSKQFEDRIEKNKSNADSLEYLVSKIVDNFNELVQNKENAEVYALVFMGANIQALYVINQATLRAENNENLLNILNRQHEHAKTVAALLEEMKNMENVKPYYAKIQPMVKYFAEKDVITIDDLKEISPLVAEARQSMIQL